MTRLEFMTHPHVGAACGGGNVRWWRSSTRTSSESQHSEPRFARSRAWDAADRLTHPGRMCRLGQARQTFDSAPGRTLRLVNSLSDASAQCAELQVYSQVMKPIPETRHRRRSTNGKPLMLCLHWTRFVQRELMSRASAVEIFEAITCGKYTERNRCPDR